MIKDTVQTAYFVPIISILGVMSFIIGYFPTLTRLHDIWLNESAYSHGYLVLFIMIYLAYEKWPKWGELPIKFTQWGVWALGLSVTSWCLFYLIDNRTLQMLSLLVILTSMTGTIWGLNGLKSLGFILFYGLFAIPIWQLLVPLLQQLAIVMVTALLSLTTIPARIEGEIISLESGRFAIAQGCSGLRYLLVSMALSTLFAYLNLGQRKWQVTVVILSIVAALVGNWLRIFGLVLIGYYTDMQSRLVVDHEDFGWAVFIITMAPVAFCAYRFQTRDMATDQHHPNGVTKEATKAVNSSDDAAVMGAILSNTSAPSAIGESVTSRGLPSFWAPRLIITILMTLLVIPLSLRLTVSYWHHQMPAAADVKDQIKAHLPHINTGRFQGPYPYNEPTELDWRPQFFGTDAAIQVSYLAKDQPQAINLHTYHYRSTRPGENVFNRQNTLVDGWYWQQHSQQVITVHGIKVQENVIKNTQGQYKLLWWWYDISGIITGSSLLGKLALIKSNYLGRSHGFIALSQTCNSQDCQAARTDIEHFFGANQEALLKSPTTPVNTY